MLTENKLPLISIQILNWNRPEETVRAIYSALNQSYSNFEIVIVDNGSTDHSVDLIKSTFPDLLVIQLDKNYGCPGGRNLGIEHCKGDYIFYLDNDGVLHKDALLNAFYCFQLDENIVVVTGKIVDFTSEKEIDTEFEPKPATPYYFNNFDGGISMHKKIMYQKTGLFPSHFMYGAEELFLSHKIFDCGFKIAKSENVVLWHKKSDNSRDHSNETINSYFNKLYTSLVLYPTSHMISFVCFFLTFYFIYAFKAGVLMKYLKNFMPKFINTLKSGLRNRNPISKNAYNSIKKFEKIEIR